jgi:sulfur carrier protein ThiS
MKVSVKVTGSADRRPRQLETEGRICDLLSQLGLSRQEYLVAVNDEVASAETPLADGDDVLLIRAVSGG